MSLLFMDGFEGGDAAQKWTSATSNPGTATNTRYGFGRSLALTNNVYGEPYMAITPSAKVVAGWAVNLAAFQYDNRQALRLYSDGGTVQHLYVQFSFSTKKVQIVRGDGTELAAVSNVLPGANVWMFCEFKATIADSGGTAEFRLNGTTVLTYTGDTRNGGTSTNIDRVQFGTMVGGDQQCYLDDVYICDGLGSRNNDFLGDVRVAQLVPTGAGASTALAASTSPNWDAVNESPYSAADYVSGSTVGNKDTYAAADLAAGVSVLGMQFNAVAKKTDVGARAIKNVVRVGGTDYSDAAGTALTSSDVTVRTLRESSPATSAAWTLSEVNAMEIGVEVA